MTDPALAENPFRLNLDQQKKRAKELHRLVLAGDSAAQARVAAQKEGSPRDPFRLADAQFVIARELGLASWPKLKAHIEEMTAARAGMTGTVQAPLDSDMPTLHIRCGNDIEKVLPLAGFRGDFLEVSNPLAIGPVREGPDWLAARVGFLDGAFGAFDVPGSNLLYEAQEKLERVGESYQRAVLWFEHDSFDQLILIYVLSILAEAHAPLRLELATAGSFPGMQPFWGLGQLPPEALRLLWERRQTVTPAQLSCAQEAFAALRAPSPEALGSLAAREDLPLPFLARALRRHLAELPGADDGLSLTQRFILDILAEEERSAGRIFRALMLEREPLPWLGDLMFWVILKEMAAAATPPLTLSYENEEDWPQARAALTPAGEAVLAGTRDYLDLAPPARWTGGVSIAPSAASWRWDRAREKLVAP